MTTNATRQPADPNVIEYFPMRRRIDSSAAAIYIFMTPLFVAALLAIAGLTELALPGGIGMAVFMWWLKRREKSRPTATLRVFDERLQVTDANRHILLDTWLDKVLDVSLDTRTIERIMENPGSAVPALRFAESVVQGAQDESRIEIRVAERSIFLTDDYLPSIDTTEWFGKIRKLLRKNGWKPESERKGAA